MSWHVIETNPGEEALADARLRSWGHRVLRPICWSTKSGKFVALFPHHALVELERRRDIGRLLKCRGVKKALRILDSRMTDPAVVPDEVVEEIRRRMDDKGAVPLHGSNGIFAQNARERMMALLGSLRATQIAA